MTSLHEMMRTIRRAVRAAIAARQAQRTRPARAAHAVGTARAVRAVAHAPGRRGHRRRAAPLARAPQRGAVPRRARNGCRARFAPHAIAPWALRAGPARCPGRNRDFGASCEAAWIRAGAANAAARDGASMAGRNEAATRPRRGISAGKHAMLASSLGRDRAVDLPRTVESHTPVLRS